MVADAAKNVAKQGTITEYCPQWKLFATQMIVLN